MDEAGQRDSRVTGLTPLVFGPRSGSGRLADVGVLLTRQSFAGSSRSFYEPEENLPGIDNAEIIETVHARRAPIPVNTSLRL